MRLFLVLFVLFLVAINGEIVNREVSRVIDASSAIVHLTIDIKASDVLGEYDLVFPDSQARHLSFLSATHKGKALEILAPKTDGNYSTYSIKLNDIAPSFKVLAVFTDLLVPFPKEIEQLENQMVLLHDNHYFLSPYFTETQKTTVKLASSNVESYTRNPPNSHKGTQIVYGPYKTVSSFSVSPFTIHSVNNKPFAKLSSMHREIEVSHWGNIAVEEIYELKHAGAALKGGFSRFDYQMRQQHQGSAPFFRTLTARLPVEAHDIYYRDQIGNISSSDISIHDDEMKLDISTRFPMFGGWQTQFYLGYSLPTETCLFLDSADSQQHTLKFDFFTIFENVWMEDVEIKVILPEGSTDVQVKVPYPVEQTMSRRFTYLDSELNGGRPVVILRAKNFVEEHDKQVEIMYRFEQKRMIVEPFMLIVFYFSFFVLCSIVARFGGSKKTTKSE